MSLPVTMTALCRLLAYILIYTAVVAAESIILFYLYYICSDSGMGHTQVLPVEYLCKSTNFLRKLQEK